jgi:O-antigen ligase
MHRITVIKENSSETVSAIFIVAFVSLFVLSNFFAGFNPVVFAVVMGISGGIAFFFPRSGLYASIFLTFIFERFFTLQAIIIGRSEYKLYPLDIIMVAILLGIIVQLLARKIRFEFKKIDFVAAIFIVAVILYGIIDIVFLGADAGLVISAVKNYAFYALLYFAAAILIRNEEDLKTLGKWVFTGALLIIGFIIYGILNGNGLWSEYTPLSTEGVRTLAFTHAYYLSIALIIAVVWQAFQKKEAGDWASALVYLIPIWAIGIVGSMMRHLWISLFVSLLSITLMLKPAQRKIIGKNAFKYSVAVLCFAVVLIFSISLAPNSDVTKKMTDSFSMISNRAISVTNSEDESIAWRSVVWQQTLDQYKKNPVFGIGLGKKVSVEIGDYKDFVEVRNIHNSFLVLFVQMGIVGVGLLAFLIYSLLKDNRKNAGNGELGNTVRYATIGILVLQLVAFMFQPYLETNLLGIFFWINLGIMRSVSKKDHLI